MNTIQIAFRVLCALAFILGALVAGMLLSPMDVRSLIGTGIVFTLGATWLWVFLIRPA